MDVIRNINRPMFNPKSVTVIYLVILVTIASCAWFDRSEHEKIIGDYEVGWSDLVRNRNISKPIKDCSGCYNVLVQGYVYAVGHNDSFIIAKQRSSNDTATYFYIIDTERNEKFGGDNGVYASLDKTTFDSLRQRMNITDIPFDMNYPENP
jgi:hypothetical protein